MKIIDCRLLRGPNVFSMTRCCAAVIESEPAQAQLGSERAAELARQLGAFVALPPPESPPADAGDDALPALVARAAAALQSQVGPAVEFAAAERLPGTPTQHRVRCGYAIEALAEPALRSAVQWLDALAAGRPFDAPAALAALQAAAERSAVDAASRALLDAAAARGIPVLRLDEDQPRIQLGWGSRQQRPVVAAELSSGAGAALVDRLFAAGADGRIPLVAVTGTNGKTTTTLLIAHALRAAGRRTGTTTTEGVFIGEQRVERGDCTGYWSARSVLLSPQVDVGVLETARGGILKRGLAFDRCDVGVVLNVAADHLGLDGVETVDDLARVKGLIARCAGRFAVLNAEDARCVAMAETLRDGCQAVYFAMDPRQATVARQLRHGGRAATFEDGWLVLHGGGQRRPLVRADALPVTLHGHARHNIANALAAAAALQCLGLDDAAIAGGLAGFTSDAGGNPLRANRFEVAGVPVIVDYAHNLAAYRALCTAARGLLSGPAARLVGVVTSPGDRRSSDLFDVGAACGEGFDELVVYEVDRRGRAAGDTVEAILAGARSRSADGAACHAEPDVRRALALGLARCRPGDLLVFTCGDTDRLVDAVRASDVAAAERIESMLAR